MTFQSLPIFQNAVQGGREGEPQQLCPGRLSSLQSPYLSTPPSSEQLSPSWCWQPGFLGQSVCVCVREFPPGLQGGQDPRAGPGAGVSVQVAQAGVVPWMHPLLAGQGPCFGLVCTFLCLYTKRDNIQIEKWLILLLKATKDLDYYKDWGKCRPSFRNE